MRALVLEGKDQQFIYKEVDKPALSEGEVLVKIKATSFNRRDYWIKKGQYTGLKFPIILGSDGSGIVVDAFNQENKHLLEQEVIINPSLHWGGSEDYQAKEFNILGLPENGTFAEFVKVPVENIHKKPAHLSFTEAATIPLAGLTSYRALFSKANLQKGENVLIVGAGAGTSTFAILWAVAVGANVYVTSGNQEKIEAAKKLGAIDGVIYKDEDWDQQLLQKVNGFDVIMDSALGEGFAKHLNYVNPGARIVFFGGTAGNLPELNGRIIFWKQVQILGTTMGSPKDFSNLLKFIEEHQIHPIVDSVYNLEDGNDAMELMENSEQFGKIVLSIEE